MNKHHLLLLLLHVCCSLQMWGNIDYISEALDLSQVANGTSTEVVIRAAGNDANDQSYGFVFFNSTSPGRFKIDTGTTSKEQVKEKEAYTAYTFTLTKTSNGTYNLREHVNNYYLPGFTTGINGFGSANAVSNFEANENSSCTDYLDNTHCYSFTYTAEGGFTILKNSNEFQVNNKKPTLYLQFFRCASADVYAHFPALYSNEDINTLRSSLVSAQNDNEANSAIEALRASANNKVITIKSTTTAYSNQGSEYLYVDNNDAKTTDTPNPEEGAFFVIEYATGGCYRLMSLSNKQYLAPTTGKSTAVDANKIQATAGLYSLLWNVAGNAGSHVVLACQNAAGNEAGTYYALHRNGSHNLVTWTVDAAASLWTLEAAQYVVIKYTDTEGHDLREAETHYFLGDETTVMAPPIDGYETSEASVTAHHGDVVTFAYSLKSYDITYTYTDAETKSVIKTDVFPLHIGDPLPEVVAPSGYQVLTQIEGNVTGERNYTIVCLNLNSTDHPDPVAPEKPAKVNLTYQFVGPDGTVWYEKEMGEVNNGEAYPAHGITLPADVTTTQPTGTLNTMESTLTVQIPCTTTFKLKYADSYGSIDQWYGVTITNNKTPFHYESGDTYMTLSGSASMENKYLFALVGNPITGFKFYNKAAGDGKILSSPNPATTTNSSGNAGTGQYCWPVMRDENALPSGNNTHWDLTANGAGYYIARHGETGYHLNSRADSGNDGSVLAYWNSTGDGSRVYFAPEGIEVTTTTPDTDVPEVNKIYRIYSVRSKGYMIYEDASHNLMKTNEKTNNRSQLWVVESSSTDGAYTLRNAETGRFVVAPTGNDAQAVTQAATTPLYFLNKEGNNDSNNKPYYGIGGNATGTGSNWLNTNNSNMKVIGYSLGSDVGSGWVFEEANDYTLDQIKAHVKANDPYASLTSDKYYRLVNKLYPTRHMVENYAADRNVRGLEDNAVANLNSQIWRIEGSDENGYTLQNAFTGNYIQYPTSGKQFTTTTEQSAAKKFLVTTTGGSDWSSPAYAFYHSSDNKNNLHCENTWNIVTWTYENAQASFWYLEPVELSSDQLTAIQNEYHAYLQQKEEITSLNAHASDINATLATIFTDPSCSELNDTYKGLSDYRIGLAFNAMGLSEAVKQMAIRVKHNTWVADKDATYNKYVRDFRIADYEPYSDCSVWNNITKVGPFGCATNPTGITVKSGDVLYVYVGDDVKDNDAELMLELVDDTNRSGTRSQALRKGLNTYQAPHNGEVFVFYNVTNPDKYVYAAKGHDADYPNIRVHIEGGEATGMWDAHRGMTDEQWDWLCDNMFGAQFLHIKGNNTVIHCVTNNVRTAKRLTDVMKIYDFIFMTEERLIGHDGQWDGRYKPVMCYRDGYSGNPNWGGGSVNIPGIGEGSLNYNSLMNERWVIYHEEAHGHQYPVNLAATTESSNNGFAQMVNHEFGLSSRRGNGVKTLIDFKNNGWGWVDMLRGGEGISRENNFEYYGDCVWLQNHLFYQLYLYFHVAGYMPDFWPRLCDEMRSNGGIIKSSDVNNPTLYYNDYFKFAKACAKVSKTDLTEFFDAYGFFGFCEDVKVGNTFSNSKKQGFVDRDRADEGIRYVGDYGSYYLRMPMKTDQEDLDRIKELKDFMKSQPNKAPNIMFIDDHIKDRVVADTAFAATLDPSLAGQPVKFYDGYTGRQGDFGDMADFNGKNEASNLDYSISGNTVTMTGDGLVGVKIYDEEGNLLYIYNTETFELKEGVADKLTDGTYTLVAALGNDTNLPLAKPDVQKYEMTIYGGSDDSSQTYLVTGEAAPTNVPYSTLTGDTDVPAISANAMMLLPKVNSTQYFSLPKAIQGSNVFYNNGTEEEPKWETFTFALTDKADFYLPAGEYEAAFTNYTRTNTAGLNSVCLPFDTQASNYGEGAKTYVLREVGESSISFVQTDDVIPAGTFCLVDCGDNGADWNIVGMEQQIVGSPLPTDEGGQGSFRNSTIGAGMYKLNNAGTKFGITTASGKVTAFRGYLNLPASGGTRQFALSLEDAPIVTGVDEVQSLQPTYATDLQGRTTLTLQRGKTYIINGKKTLAR